MLAEHSDTVSRWNKAQDFPHDGASTLRNLCVGAEEGDARARCPLWFYLEGTHSSRERRGEKGRLRSALDVRKASRLDSSRARLLCC